MGDQVVSHGSAYNGAQDFAAGRQPPATLVSWPNNAAGGRPSE